MISRPIVADAPEYYSHYFGLVPQADLFEAFDFTEKESIELFSSIPGNKELFRYAPGKWTVKEVISHITDTERILTYRALRFSRGDRTMLAAFDENLFAPNSNSEKRKMQDMIDEFIAVRHAGILLFRSFSQEMLDVKGQYGDLEVSVRSIGWMIAGHNVHHCKVIRERYL